MHKNLKQSRRTSVFKPAVFLICLLVGLTIYLCQISGVSLPSWINNYVNDFLTLPIVLSVSLFIVRKLKKDSSIILPLTLIILVASLYSVYFELYLPKVTTRYTQDPIDVILYFLGGFAYYKVNKHF